MTHTYNRNIIINVIETIFVTSNDVVSSKHGSKIIKDQDVMDSLGLSNVAALELLTEFCDNEIGAANNNLDICRIESMKSSAKTLMVLAKTEILEGEEDEFDKAQDNAYFNIRTQLDIIKLAG